MFILPSKPVWVVLSFFWCFSGFWGWKNVTQIVQVACA